MCVEKEKCLAHNVWLVCVCACAWDPVGTLGTLVGGPFHNGEFFSFLTYVGKIFFFIYSSLILCLVLVCVCACVPGVFGANEMQTAVIISIFIFACHHWNHFVFSWTLFSWPITQSYLVCANYYLIDDGIFVGHFHCVPCSDSIFEFLFSLLTHSLNSLPFFGFFIFLSRKLIKFLFFYI